MYFEPPLSENMRFTVIAAALACATTVLGAPGTAIRRERAARRLAQRSSRTRQPATDGGVLSITELRNDTETHVQYSSNWAGAVLIGNGYTSVTGIITVPTPKTPSGGSSSTEYAASAWVGIDGDTCETAILQTGVDFFVQGSSVSFSAWYEWYPDYSYDFSGLAIDAGDEIRMTVSATGGGKGGKAIVENLTTGKSASHSFSNESDVLCETNAEWIVEDFSSSDSLVPFADFDTVTFTDASVTTGSGKVGVTGATIMDIRQNNKILTKCGTSGSSSVTCSYV